ncbi:hypothetical protein [Planctomicrobium sp. SH527]|uniref:hypothetical protein n=1 Tax=Planctomicrobium sp. SH527 TaxID=3448123 RepID=UPI003F5C98FE
MSYTPGLQVKAATHYRVQRVLPIPGDLLVHVDDTVTANQIVARANQPGDLFPVNIANALGISPGDVASAMRKTTDETVEPGELLAESNGLFGYFKKAYHSQIAGIVESVSNVTGQVILRGTPQPVQINAFVDGKVIEVLPPEGVVVETTAAFIQGIFGIGGEQHGPLKIVVASPDEDLVPERIKPEHAGCIIVSGRRIHGDAVIKARDLGVVGIISGGIDDQDLKAILGYDIGVAITGSEQIGLTLIITEGFGDIAMAQHTFSLLQSLAGQNASINGATQIRAGVLRPEIVVPLVNLPANSQIDFAERVAEAELSVGATVRLIRDPYFGELGTVTQLPIGPQRLDSGSKARVLEVKCLSGKTVTVPRANVEIVVE